MKPVHIAASAWVAATVTACASAPREIIAAESAVHDADIDLNLQPVAWPVSFRRHNFSSVCFDTLSCRIFYGGVPTFQDTPSLPSSHYGPNYLDLVRGTYGAIPNFPDPAKIEWVSKDGTHHKAEIDIGSIFRDQRVLHNVPREEIPDQPDGRIAIDPQILLEINDRTVRVYMRAFEHRRVPQDPAQYTIFQARGATAVYGLRMDDDGQRNLRDELANCKIVDICHDAEPVDRALAWQFAWQFVTPVIPEPPARLPEPLAAEPLKPEPAPVNPYAASLGREAGPASLPVLQFSDPLHPDHGLYQEARGLVHALDRQHGKSPDRYSDNLAAALVVAARANGLERVERLQFNDDASHVAAVQSPYGEPERQAEVPVIAAMNTPLQRSAERWPVAMEAFEQLARDRAQEQAMERQRAQALPQQPWPGYPQHPASMQQGLAPIAPPVGAIPAPGVHEDFDPRQLGPEKFALYSLLQERIPEASPDRLLQFTAACHQHYIDAETFDTIRVYEEDLTILFDGKSFISTPAVIDLSQPPPEPEESLQQIREVDQVRMEIAREHALSKEMSQGPVL